MCGELDQSALIAALHELIERHHILRTTYTRAGTSGPRAVVVPMQQFELDIDLHDVTDLQAEGAERAAVAIQLLQEAVATPFELYGGVVIRVVLVRDCCSSVPVQGLFVTLTCGWAGGVRGSAGQANHFDKYAR